MLKLLANRLGVRLPGFAIQLAEKRERARHVVANRRGTEEYRHEANKVRDLNRKEAETRKASTKLSAEYKFGLYSF